MKKKSQARREGMLMGEMRGLVYVLLVTFFLAVSWLVRIMVSGKVHKKVEDKKERNKPGEE